MTVLDIAFGDGALIEYALSDFQGGDIKKMAALDDGTSEGHPSVAIVVEGRDGKIIIAQTTWRLFYTACTALIARYGIPE